MRHHLLLIALVAAIVAPFICCTHNGGSAGTSQEVQDVDTSYIEARVQAIYEEEPERALSMIQSAEISGSLPSFRADLLRARLFTMSVNDQRQETAQSLCEQLLHNDSVKRSPAYQQMVLELLVNASRMRHDDEQWMRWALQLSELLHQRHNESEALRTEAEIGLVMTHLGQVNEGMAKIDHALELLDGQKDFSSLLSFILASKRKMTVLRETGRHADIPPVAQRIEDCLADFEQHPSDYSGGRANEPKTPEERTAYCDFYGAQAMAFKAAAYAEMGDAASARRELQLFDKTKYSHTNDGRKMIAPTLGKLGDYATMLAIYDEAEAEMRGDTLRYDYAEMLLARSEAAEAWGHLTASLDYRKRYDRLTQTLNDRLHRNQTHDYAARYHAQEQQMEIERQNAELTRMNYYISMGVLVTLLAVAFAIYFFRQKRMLYHKNHVLVEQISGAIEYKRRYRESLPPADNTDAVETAAPVASEKPADLNSLTDEQLFQYISGVILSEKLYLNPVCDRQTITDRFGLSEKRVGAAFSKGSSYKSLASFVRDSRLEYACQLLRQNPGMTIGSVAQASGFSNHTRFTADFKARYSVSPTEFRSLSE
ncbi:MAG: helix-turn-helix domain-containing protein [Prevotella sp.]|nr:helix-turn-helix domain-containing protein [Prevotella sp.]